MGTIGDRHAGGRAQRVASALLPQPGRDAIRRRQAVNRAAAERQRIDGLYQIVFTQRVGFPGGGAAAAYVHGGDRRAVRQDNRCAGTHPAVLCRADLQARHIGNQVAGAWAPAAEVGIAAPNGVRGENMPTAAVRPASACKRFGG